MTSPLFDAGNAAPAVPTPLFRRKRLRRACLFGCLTPVVGMALCMIVYLIFPPDPVDMLILGVDARPGQRYLTRTDAVVLVNVNPGDLGITMLSIPRDVFIYVPDYGEQRINTINVLGEQEAEGSGPALVKASFKESFGVNVENTIRLDFNGFVALVDAVGGVDIDVPKLIIDYEYPTLDGGIITVRFDPGVEHMDGERALQYARTRHQDDDYQRAERQQQVIDAVVKKLATPWNVARLPAAWRAFRDHTDTDLSAWDMLRMAPALVLGWPGRDQRVLQREDLIGMKAGYWRPDYDKLNPWIARHFD
jgi:LCP family protein required for cell wall assembly